MAVVAAVVAVVAVATEAPCGVGLTFRPQWAAQLERTPRTVDFLEITADHYLGAPRAKMAELERLAGTFTLVPHALELSLGSACGLDAFYLAALAQLIRRIKAPVVSEHLAFCRTPERTLPHFAPVPWNEAALAVLCANIARAQEVLAVPLLLENIAWSLIMPGAEMDEAQFLSCLVERCGVGLMLDVANLHANAVNFHIDSHAYLRRLPPEAVVQVHIAGGSWSDTWYVDSHDAPVPEPVWALLQEALDLFPIARIVLERDDHIPPLAELANELARARSMWLASKVGIALHAAYALEP